MRAAMADITAKEAKAARDQAEIQKTMVNIRQILASTAGENIDTQARAIESALMAITSPGAIRVADGMLREAGYVSRTEEEDIAAQTEQAIAAQQMQQQAQQQPQQPQQPQALGLQ